MTVALDTQRAGVEPVVLELLSHLWWRLAVRRGGLAATGVHHEQAKDNDEGHRAANDPARVVRSLHYRRADPASGCDVIIMAIPPIRLKTK